jgi:hypothetical protein
LTLSGELSLSANSSKELTFVIAQTPRIIRRNRSYFAPMIMPPLEACLLSTRGLVAKHGGIMVEAAGTAPASYGFIYVSTSALLD